LHREEFAWPRMSPHAPVRSYIKPLRAAPFHPSPRLENLRFQIWNPKTPSRLAGVFSVALVVTEIRQTVNPKSKIWNPRSVPAPRR